MRKGYKPTTNFIVDEDGNFPSRYITTKSVFETLDEIGKSSQNVSTHWLDPIVTDVRHDEIGVVEIIYVATVEVGLVIANPGYKLVSIDELKAEEKYARAIVATPRSIGN